MDKIKRDSLSSTPALGAWVAALTPLGGFLFALESVAVVAGLDYLTGYEIRLAILYLLPIFLATWSGGWRPGAVISTAATLCWFWSFRSSNPYSEEIYYYWEGVIMVATFGAFVFLLTRLHDALIRADARFLRVLEELYAAVYVVERDTGMVLYANQRFQQLLNVDPLMLHSQDFEKRFLSVSAGGSEHSNGNTPGFISSEIRDEDSGRWYLLQAGPIPWTNDRFVILKVLTDISEQKQAQLLRSHHQETMNTASRLVASAEIASTLAHEINQPLMAIASYNNACLRLLSSQRYQVEELREAMEKCRDQAMRAGQIINRMRDFIRRRQPNQTLVDPNMIVREVAHLVETELEQAGVRSEFTLSEKLPQILADRILIGQVVINLVNNAVDAMRSVGPERRRIVFETGVDADGAVRISVRDGGPGIPEPLQQRLYSPFFTTKPHGLGLGLSICHSIIEAHGGRIWHSNNPEGGSCFHFTLPVETL